MDRTARRSTSKQWLGIGTTAIALTLGSTAALAQYDTHGAMDSSQQTDRSQQINPPDPMDASKQVDSSKQMDSEPADAQRLQVEDELLAEQVAKHLVASAFDTSDGVEASDDMLGGWEITGEDIDLKIEATDGALRLSGTVDRTTRIKDLEADARDIPGVQSVTSNLQIASSKTDGGFLDDEEESAE